MFIHIVGARPQFVKVAAVLGAVEQPDDHALLHTGQHYDPRLSQVFFDELAIRPPAWDLGVGSGPHGAQTAAMLTGIERVLLRGAAGDVVVVYGDTNSTLAGALAAAKLGRTLVHVEAGLRSGERHMPEEINRVVADRLADLALCPTPTAVQCLTLEGLAAGARNVGDVMLDIALARRDEIRRTPIGRYLESPAGVPPGPLDRLHADAARAQGYALATIHRAANTDDPRRLGALLDALGDLPWPVLLPIHPRTQSALNGREQPARPRVHLVEPLGYLDMAALLTGAAMVLTDSGGLQKEAFFASRPCVTLRDRTEWPETLVGGWNVLADGDAAAINAAATRAVPTTLADTRAFGDGRAAQAVARALEAL